ncbi:hypothetical protein AAG906_027914 [Vitis piasezkii]
MVEIRTVLGKMEYVQVLKSVREGTRRDSRWVCVENGGIRKVWEGGDACGVEDYQSEGSRLGGAKMEESGGAKVEISAVSKTVRRSEGSNRLASLGKLESVRYQNFPAVENGRDRCGVEKCWNQAVQEGTSQKWETRWEDLKWWDSGGAGKSESGASVEKAWAVPKVEIGVVLENGRIWECR